VEVRVVVVAGLAVKVAVKLGLLFRTALQGLVVPEHVDEMRLLCPLHPEKTYPVPAVAVKVTEAPLSEVVMFGEHVLVTVCEAAFTPVPPQLVGALTVPLLGVIVTDPVPTIVRFKLRASVNVVSAVIPEGAPVAITWKRAPTSAFTTS
jgi:hypothetical protein